MTDTVRNTPGERLFAVNPPLFLDSSMVEHSAVNRRVVGSSPTRGVNATCKSFLQVSSFKK